MPTFYQPTPISSLSYPTNIYTLQPAPTSNPMMYQQAPSSMYQPNSAPPPPSMFSPAPAPAVTQYPTNMNFIPQQQQQQQIPVASSKTISPITTGAAVEPVEKPPLPIENQKIQSVFDGLLNKCMSLTNGPAAKRKLEDVSKKLDALYDKLRASGESAVKKFILFY